MMSVAQWRLEHCPSLRLVRDASTTGFSYQFISRHDGFSVYNCITGWWLTYPSEKYDFVSWDDDYSQYMEK
jgi:hypothetical protein